MNEEFCFSTRLSSESCGHVSARRCVNANGPVIVCVFGKDVYYQ